MAIVVLMPLSSGVTRRQLFQLAAGQALAGPPDIIFIVADDLGYGELGCQGNSEIPTPHIDSIARNGIRFTQGYVTAPYCAPSRAGFLTGRYQSRFGYEQNVTGKQNLNPETGLPLTERTLASHLKTAGYRTAIFGKWHLGATPKFHPLRRGFDEFHGFLHEGHFFVPPPYNGATSYLRTNEPPYDDHNPIQDGEAAITEPGYLTQATAQRAAGFLRRSGPPAFVYLPFNAVHSPMQATPEYLARFRHIPDLHRRVFAAMLASLDDAVGEVLRHARPNTLVFFISDNGGPTAELTSGNQPLRGGKGQLYEGGIRVPFLVQWAGRIPPGQTRDEPVISLDIAATCLEAAGIARPANLDGHSLLKPLPARPLFWRYGPNEAVREGAWKLVRQGGVQHQLFNLAGDPAETRDLAASQPERAAALRRLLENEAPWASAGGVKG
ncbi:MAG: N-acetylgalactosamine-4-sulfatase [Acidobacteria bacterium]|nr:N-acetylgalactosamine-4-sulfatase [Acidobacteriota bacterium]